jgi:hypothetical protein
MSLQTLVVIPCGKAKIWDKTPDCGPIMAKDAYVGPPFKVNRKFAEKFADKWIILSAKYGFIDPDFIIPENYDVSFTRKCTRSISLESLLEQFSKRKDLHGYDVVIALGGVAYTEKVVKVFNDISQVIVPTRGLRQGEAMRMLNSLLTLEKSEMLRHIEGQSNSTEDQE